MTNDIQKVKSVTAGSATDHGIDIDSPIMLYTYEGSSKTIKWILDKIFQLLSGKAASSHTHEPDDIWIDDEHTGNLTGWIGSTDYNIGVLQDNYQDKSFLVTSLNGGRTHQQYPSAKCVYDALAGKATSATTLAGYGITDAYTKTQVNTSLERKVGEYPFDGTHTSGSQQINLDTYLTQNGMAGMFHIYSGRENTVDLGDLLTTSIEGMQFSFFGSYKNIPSGSSILCHICRHDNLSGGGWYLVYVISRDEKVTSLSDQSTDLQYPSAKCVYDELQAIKARLSALEA